MNGVALSGQRAQPGAAVHEEVWLRFPPPFLLGKFEKCIFVPPFSIEKCIFQGKISIEKCKMLLGDEEKDPVSLLF